MKNNIKFGYKICLGILIVLICYGIQFEKKSICRSEISRWSY